MDFGERDKGDFGWFYATQLCQYDRRILIKNLHLRDSISNCAF